MLTLIDSAIYLTGGRHSEELTTLEEIIKI